MYSPCPIDTSRSAGEMDNFSHAPNDINHFGIPAGARAYYLGGIGKAVVSQDLAPLKVYRTDNSQLHSR